jgi:RNA polymerase sigma-70 factor (ECF subfamily)
VVDAFFRATRGGGDFEALVQLLHPDVVLRADIGGRRPGASTVVRGVAAVSRHARWIPGASVRPALVNGAAGAVISVAGRPLAVMGFTIVDDIIVEIDAIADPERVRTIAAAVIDERATNGSD